MHTVTPELIFFSLSISVGLGFAMGWCFGFSHGLDTCELNHPRKEKQP